MYVDVCWDLALSCYLADTFIHTAGCFAGYVAELAAASRVEKYSHLELHCVFQLVTYESLGPVNVICAG